ncbi:hypothetical protein ACIHAR_04930 [Streptomyces sp. NPDC052016]|uniref:hypothetical protein n=1 Tax=unclassified Streptomyces TaxID=2593676 RepID=UPI00343EBACD
MHSDVVSRAAAHAVGEARPTGSHAESEVTGSGRVSLQTLSLRNERSVLRAAAVDDDVTAGFQSHI